MNESIRAQLVALQPGRSWSESHKIRISEAAMVQELVKKMRDRVNASVARAKDETGSHFATNTIKGITDPGDAVIICVVVTRES